MPRRPVPETGICLFGPTNMAGRKPGMAAVSGRKLRRLSPGWAVAVPEQGVQPAPLPFLMQAGMKQAAALAA